MLPGEADLPLAFLSGGGACGEIARAMDWSTTPLGAPSSWSPALRTAFGLALHSRSPMMLFWGPELVLVYNDACLPSLQERHPAAMGKRAADFFRQTWPSILSELLPVIRDARPLWREDHLVPVLRADAIEEAYWTYSNSPVFEDGGVPGGVLTMFTETTARVLASRRDRTLRAIAERLESIGSADELLPAALDVLGEAPCDVPFAFALDRSGAAPRIDCVMGGSTATLGDAARASAAAQPGTVIPLAPVHVDRSRWPEPVRRGFVAELPPRDDLPAELVVVGLSPRLPFDAAYRAFLEQVTSYIALARARVTEFERRARAKAEQRSLLLQSPIATLLMAGPDHVIELANRAFVETTNRRALLGKPYVEAFPELEDTDLPLILDRVYRTGEPFAAEEHLIPLKRQGVIEDRWFKFNLQPMRDARGEVRGIMYVTDEVTDAVTARRSLEKLSAEREKWLAALEAANRSKDEFLAMLGHELRNPLAPITTALHLMKLKEPSVLARERDIIERQTSHLVHLVDDLLDVSRVARGKVTLNKCRVSLSDVISRAVEIASPLFEQRGHVLTISVPTEGLVVEGDPVRLGQVFSNLLTNAAKYTDPGGRVAVRAAREGDAVVVRVEDNGAGIRPEQLTCLFDAFVQGPRASDRALGGLGLGLALVKSFVTLHGGTVTAHSQGLGHGSMFEVRLPALATDAKPARAAAAPATPPRPAERARRVLLVDDSEDILEIVATLLRHEGYEVLEAHDGPSALQLAPSFGPDVAVLDIGLPAMDGYELAQHLREELGERTPKLVAMTGYGQEADRARAREAGFAVHLVKPVDPSALLDSIRAE